MIVYGSASVSVVPAAVRAATVLILSQNIWKGLQRMSGKDFLCIRGLLQAIPLFSSRFGTLLPNI